MVGVLLIAGCCLPSRLHSTPLLRCAHIPRLRDSHGDPIVPLRFLYRTCPERYGYGGLVLLPFTTLICWLRWVLRYTVILRLLRLRYLPHARLFTFVVVDVVDWPGYSGYDDYVTLLVGCCSPVIVYITRPHAGWLFRPIPQWQPVVVVTLLQLVIYTV